MARITKNGRVGASFGALACALALAALVPAAAGAAADPGERVDASCEGPAAATVSFAAASAPTGRYAQTFTVSSSGRLTHAEATINNAGGTADYVVQIVGIDGSGAPGSTVYSSATVAGASVP